MDEQLEQVIKQLESWSENHTEISLTVEIGFFALALAGGLAVFGDMFVFENQLCRLLFQPARCSDVLDLLSALFGLANLGRKVVSTEQMREKHRSRLHFVNQRWAS
jgi:hypothetical protein